jgi:hypothetical protein
MFKTAGDSTRSAHSVLIKVNKREKKNPRIMTNQSEDDRDVYSGGFEGKGRQTDAIKLDVSVAI